MANATLEQIQSLLSAAAQRLDQVSQQQQTFQGQVFGVIANESEPFCADCDRLRLDASGVVYGCIGADKGIALPVNPQPEQMALALQQAMNQKQTLKFSGSRSSMMAMGG